jgi:hypothetical protein
MSQQQSFTKIENELLPKFRKRINEAESTEDIKKFFCYCVQELLERAFAGRLKVEYGDVALDPEGDPPFQINERIKSREDFIEVWNVSDLPQIVGRFSLISLNHYKHIGKNPEKTEAKIRM